VDILVDIRITPLSQFSTQSKRQGNTQLSRSYSSTSQPFNQPATPLKTKKSVSSQVLTVTSKKPSLPANNPHFSQQATVSSANNKKGLSLYRQVESNLLFQGGELVNRFNYKV